MNQAIRKIINMCLKQRRTYSICALVGQPMKEITTEADWQRAQRAARRLHREGYRRVRIVSRSGGQTAKWDYDGSTFTKAE